MHYKLLHILNTNRRRILPYLLGCLSLGFIVLTIVVTCFPTTLFDIEISTEIQEHHNDFLDYFMRFISWFGYTPISEIMIVATGIVFYIFRHRRDAVFIFLTAISGIISSVIKIIINRPRPTEDVVRIIEKAKQQSFPSGHTLFYTVFFGFVIFLMLYLKIVKIYLRIVLGSFSALMIFLIPFSRVYLGAHWFTDVAAGMILGLICLYLLCLLYLNKAVFRGLKNPI